MNLSTGIPAIILILINMAMGVLLVTGKLQISIVRKQEEEEPTSQPLLAAVDETPKRKRGRPCKDDITHKQPRHYYLPATVTDKQIDRLGVIFKQYRDSTGERIVFHVPLFNGTDKKIEVPYLVQWNDMVKDTLGKELGGWS